MAEAVYALCAVTSVVCAALLGRAYARTRTRLLLWSTLCFAGLAINNVLLFVDLVLLPDVDLRLIRIGSALIALGLLVYGLIRESR